MGDLSFFVVREGDSFAWRAIRPCRGVGNWLVVMNEAGLYRGCAEYGVVVTNMAVSYP